MFHGSRFIDKIQARDDCSYEAFPAGHWVMDSHAKEMAITIEKFLA